MSTTTEKPPTGPSKPEHHDEFTGAFGFFRKYQKLILYTAGIFALVTFSITGAMTQWMQGLTSGSEGPQPSIVVGGERVQLQVEDTLAGGRLARNRVALPPTVLPDPLLGGDGSDLATRFAILRRASIASGLEVSMDEVDAAIDLFVRMMNARTSGSNTPTQLALQRGMNSLAEYRSLVQEGLRIGNYVILNSLGVDASDAAVMHKLVTSDSSEKLTCRVALFDMKALEKELEAKGDVTEDDIKAWMEAKTDAEKARLEVFDSNRVALRIGVIMLDEFDPTEWTEELEGFEVGDERLKQLYNEETWRFQETPESEPKPMDDEEVAAKLRRIAEVEEVLTRILSPIRAEEKEISDPLIEELNRRDQEMQLADKDVKVAQKALDDDPENEELKVQLRAAQDRLIAMEAALAAQQKLLDDTRANFDFVGRWQERAKDRKGVSLREIPDKRNNDKLKDLSDVGLGQWKMPERATALSVVGGIGAVPARTENGGFLFQVTDVERRPLKPWDDIKEHLQQEYFKEKAKEIGDEKKQKLTDELLRMAKEQAADKFAEIEQRRQEDIDRRYNEWEDGVRQQLQRATDKLTELQVGTEAYAGWSAKKTQLETDLQNGDARRTLITADVDKEIAADIQEEARKHYPAVFTAAAESAGFTVLPEVGPYRRDLRTKPNFEKRYDRTVGFLWKGPVTELDVGESTEIQNDAQERRWVMAVCDAVAPLTIADVTRREFANQRRLFELSEMLIAMRQSFTVDALKERYGYEEPVGQQRQ